MIDKDALLALLRRHAIDFEAEQHAPVHNMAESDTLALTLAGARCKNLLLRDKPGNTWLVVTRSHKSLDLAAAADAFGSRRLSFASPERLDALLGVKPGSLSPLALVNDSERQVRLVIDAELADEPVFLFHPLDSGATLALARPQLDAFLRLTGHAPAWLTLAARAPA
ncbi:prolyl-tRNA synthetase associated domain-containing protein [Burkholderia plantarii]|uniref:prolyl-tRNA synthetase associated domain-containing protein n=1 Tax=Burkholderia plantarii TaxID=41899 RepID=UPI0006D8A442|nr:prolyl-tRNA synthetase associated domain-containing protein [Burkholderia plantarii]ALK29895.1 prolyl-tRNA synthetase associated protein [Burkholderia plantarii]GLZ20815.1 DNA-binding protein [Burkholderia plantarii]